MHAVRFGFFGAGLLSLRGGLSHAASGGAAGGNYWGEQVSLTRFEQNHTTFVLGLNPTYRHGAQDAHHSTVQRDPAH